MFGKKKKTETPGQRKSGSAAGKTKTASEKRRSSLSHARLHKVRTAKGTKRSASPTYTVTVYGDKTGRKVFATPQEASIYAQRLANRKGKKTVVIPGNFPVTHRYHLR